MLVDTADGTPLEAQIRGKVAQATGRYTSAVAVGDRVRFELTGPGAAVIVGVEPRTSALLRPEVVGRWRRQVLVANADRALLVFAQHDPPPATGLVDRLLVACHAGGVPPVLVFNKSDLPPLAEAAAIVRIYEALGYEVLRTSAATGEGLDRLHATVLGRCCVFAGPSGTGKSSLINRVIPGLLLRTGEISASTGKGRHTTTASQLVRLPGGGYMIDTPGVKEFGLLGIAPGELALQFPEFPVPNQCKFLDCRHRTEPACRVREAAAAGTIERSRYDSYLSFRTELEESESRDRYG